MSKQNIISISNFSKKFGEVTVIKNLNFEVKEGEVFAFLGANGSGKTTTIRSLLRIYEPTSGELHINGKTYTQEDSSILGYLPEERGLYVAAKVLETMIYFGQLKGLTKHDAKKRALEYLERVDLADKAESRIKQLSSGQQQKIQLGITVLNNPKLLILDEPTKGLDPVNRTLLMDILQELNNQGTTIMFSTHQMDEAEKIANRLLMLKNGEAALYGPTHEVKQKFGSNTIHLNYVGEFMSNDKLFTARIEQNFAEITPKEGISTSDILNHFVQNNVVLTRFEVSAPSLHEIFIKVSTQA